MDFHEVLRSRSSTREFSGRDVEPDKVERLLEAACRAPSAGNLQPWRFLVVRDPGVRGALAGAAHGQRHVAEAPVVIVVCADLDVCARGYGSRGESLYALQDTAAAAQNILLAAAAEGLGSCWVGAFDEERAEEALSLAPRVRPMAMLAIGYGARPPGSAPREPFGRFTRYV